MRQRGTDHKAYGEESKVEERNSNLYVLFCILSYSATTF